MRQYDDWPVGSARRLPLAPGGTFTVNTDPGPRGPGESLTYRMRPVREDVVLAGDVDATIRATFTATDGNLAVIVSDVAPDGTATRLTNGWLKASHRYGHEHPVPVRPGKVYDLKVHLWPVHHRLAEGHHLAITVASDDHPEIDSDAPAGQVRITKGTLEIATLRGR